MTVVIGFPDIRCSSYSRIVVLVERPGREAAVLEKRLGRNCMDRNYNVTTLIAFIFVVVAAVPVFMNILKM